ncbi:MAG: hypothetical protein GX111_00290 [Clostridiales bacterium]|nr:hypothetical protein [Clostridiales bacterium]
MAYTGTEIFNIAIAIIDELSQAGTISENQVKEYKYRAPYLLDMWQREAHDILRTVTIARHPLKNLLGTRFETMAHKNEDCSFETRESAGAAVFAVTDQAEVYIEDLTGEGVEGFFSRDEADEEAFTGLISVPELTSPARYKCRFDSSGPVRIRFSGDYYYLFYAVAMFDASFPSCAKVPEYGEFVKYEMPSDFYGVSEITQEMPKAGLMHKWENDKDLYVSYRFDGVLKITYRASPEKIASLTQLLEVDDASAMSGAYFLAEQFAISDMNDALAARCRGKYDELRTKLKKKRALGRQTIRDVYGISEIR